ncbi:MAG: copper amine oxidase N-terminal domain-containing protein [Vulcanimicrobiaceae bacterium]
MDNPRPLSLRTFLTTGVLALVASTALAFSHPATIQIDGRRVTSDVPPVVTSNRQTYLPLRVVTSNLGARVSYDRRTRAITVVRGRDRLKLHLGRTTAVLNGKPVRLSHAPFTVRGRTMVAARTIERTLGPKVQYNPSKSTIDVVTNESATEAAPERVERDNTAF